MTEYKTIETTLEKGVFTIWLNRPEVHNAFDITMLRELIDCFETLDPSTFCIILRGRGKSFCAGADLNWMKAVSQNSFEQNYQESLLLSKCFYTIYTCSRPTLAVIHGVALGGANGLFSACDIAYCTDDATFSLSEVKIGIVPACISPYLIKRVGESGARELMLTGRRIKGKEAEHFRLVNKSVSAEQLEPTLQAVITLLRSSGPEAMSHCKTLIHDVANKLTLAEAYEYTARMIAEIRSSREGQEGMNAFLEKRKPDWIK
ncbi:MAG: enoyl-CoA hydratase-related protein [Bacteroidales bacterium]|jgi:methylglutaconyl-CoA hydratase|nr:enoyl-CoA hydratase-related protein [Bacteroidales bacterium]